LLNFNVLILHITNNYGQFFTIDTIIHMKNHSCSASNMFHMIKHDPNMIQTFFKSLVGCIYVMRLIPF
jgi:hypothetical protein